MHGIGLRRGPQWKLEKKRDVQSNAFLILFMFSVVVVFSSVICFN